MTLIEATRSRIISLLKKKHFTQSELSTRACVSKTTINDFLNRKNMGKHRKKKHKKSPDKEN